MYICIVCVIRFVPDFSFSSTSNAHMHDFYYMMTQVWLKFSWRYFWFYNDGLVRRFVYAYFGPIIKKSFDRPTWTHNKIRPRNFSSFLHEFLHFCTEMMSYQLFRQLSDLSKILRFHRYTSSLLGNVRCPLVSSNLFRLRAVLTSGLPLRCRQYRLCANRTMP